MEGGRGADFWLGAYKNLGVGIYWGGFSWWWDEQIFGWWEGLPLFPPNRENPVIHLFFCDLSKKKLFLCMLLNQFMLTSICMKNADIRIFLCIIDNNRVEECPNIKFIFLILNFIDVTLSWNLKEYFKGVSLGLNHTQDDKNLSNFLTLSL